MQRIIVNDNARPLVELRVGRASVLECEIVGIPRGFSKVQLHVGRADTAAMFPVVAVQHPGGVWRVYANALVFPDAGRFPYHVTARDEQNGSRWIGSGYVTVLASVLNVDGSAVPPIPEDTYIRNTETGLWHKLTVTIEDGEIVAQLEQEGITK